MGGITYKMMYFLRVELRHFDFKGGLKNKAV